MSNNTSFISSENSAYISEIFELFSKNPNSVSEEWRNFFLKIDQNNNYQLNKPNNLFVNGNQSQSNIQNYVLTQNLIDAYRRLGVRVSDINPLQSREKLRIIELEPEFYGFSERDLDEFIIPDWLYEGGSINLRQLLNKLKTAYCGKIGVEFMHLSNLEERNWIRNIFESFNHPFKKQIEREDKKYLLNLLVKAEGFEQFLNNKYVGQKRFSLEGGESFIICLNNLLTHASEDKIKDVMIGMAHRGRLNMLVNIMGKPISDLFAEFDNTIVHDTNQAEDGDVKYHKGFSNDLFISGNHIHVSLAFNPSHLEIVNPVVLGNIKAKQEYYSDKNKALGILVHGDAAFCGQGVNMEMFNLSKTRGYSTGGTLHIIINNQIGFTTSDPRDTRSTLFCTDIAKITEIPIFHVNGDDPESVALVSKIAFEFRKKFHNDVVIDIVCFRKLGHNEQDTPSVTQPLMYNQINKHPGTCSMYQTKLINDGIIMQEDANRMRDKYRELIKTEQCVVQLSNKSNLIKQEIHIDLNNQDALSTGFPLEDLLNIGRKLVVLPKNFHPHALIKKLMTDRLLMMEGKLPLDWGMCEHLAFASLIKSGYSVRLAGQDSRRGTFAHRHSVLHDQSRTHWSDDDFIPLQHIYDGKTDFNVIDSILSEEAVLAFEYGYSCYKKNGLTIWEAQFGDFANGAQVVIDQFIASGETKWGQKNNLVLMLPHGYEGQGPEHSSARIERFLQLCAKSNMQITQPTNSAQIFHLLRRQTIQKIQKPLIIFTPKSLLRNKLAGSIVSDLVAGQFLRIISEKKHNPKEVKRVLFCSGKIYYDLSRVKNKHQRFDVIIIRIEQLYPFPSDLICNELDFYPIANEFIWVQDEPKNQGAWSYIQDILFKYMKPGQKLACISREASSSSAVGSYSKHLEQQNLLLDQAFSPSHLIEFNLLKF